MSTTERLAAALRTRHALGDDAEDDCGDRETAIGRALLEAWAMAILESEEDAA